MATEVGGIYSIENMWILVKYVINLNFPRAQIQILKENDKFENPSTVFCKSSGYYSHVNENRLILLIVILPI